MESIVKYDVYVMRAKDLLLLRSSKGTFKATLFSFSPVHLFPQKKKSDHYRVDETKLLLKKHL